MTGNEYQKLAARTINQGLTFEEQKIHALYTILMRRLLKLLLDQSAPI